MLLSWESHSFFKLPPTSAKVPGSTPDHGECTRVLLVDYSPLMNVTM